jgi:hypothetical protein
MKEDKAPEVWGQGLFVDSAESLREHLRSSVRQALKELFEEEIRILCGARYHPGGSDYHRAGSSPSYVMTDARREPMDRPRVRRATVDGRSEEVQLRSWKMAQSPDEWESAMMRAVLCGVSTRGCGRLRVADLRHHLEVYFHFYNHERPHSSLGGRPPAEIHDQSTRKEVA